MTSLTHPNLIERLNNASNGLFEVHPLGDYGICEEAAQAISTLEAEVAELRELLERWLRLADSGHFRDAAELSLSAHPVADDTRATLTKAEGQ